MYSEFRILASTHEIHHKFLFFKNFANASTMSQLLR